MGFKSVMLVIDGRFGGGVACIVNKKLKNCWIDELEVRLAFELEVELELQLELELVKLS